MEVAGLTLGVVSLLAGFKGAVDGYLLIDDLIRKDNGIKNRVLGLELIKTQLDQWKDDFTAHVNGDSLLNYESDENQKKIIEILGRMEHHLKESEIQLKKHTEQWTVKPKKSLFRLISKDRASWVVKDRQLLDDIIAQLEKLLENLSYRTKEIEELKYDFWTNTIHTRLSRIDETASHMKARDVRQEGTCQWIFQRTDYKDWVSKKTVNFLWIDATRMFASTLFDLRL